MGTRWLLTERLRWIVSPQQRSDLLKLMQELQLGAARLAIESLDLAMHMTGHNSSTTAQANHRLRDIVAGKSEPIPRA
jgi:hypothetical protein